MIRFDDVTAGYGGEAVVSDVDLTVPDGAVTCLLGPNGVGKSTLLKCAVGLLDPVSGAVSVDGTPLAECLRDEVARRAAFVPQSTADTYPATVFEMVLMGRKPHAGWRPSTSDRELVASALERLDVDHLATRRVGELSGGQRRKVVLARALAQGTGTLVLDEPTHSLDIRRQLEVLECLRREVTEGTAALVAMHDLTLAARYADRFVLLADGEVYARGDDAVLTPAAIEAVYGIEVSVAENGAIVPERPSDGDV